ncbi:hypothetical protein CDL15_Pgr009407 [Punica granatum]|uniref:PB1-like domain-containing protein n=1 Tax=Punica granatum TaxID=22663 RepID=A0A218WSZ2_PUNGR|nr:hypothetical protein CDL15_Pgr009407 [Punica granatum]PKI60449.1 hypothetical protein CRG98_019103 [Punica granatum]
MEDDNHKFVSIPSLHLWKTVDVYLYHGGKFVRESKVSYEGGDIDIIRNVDVDTITAAGVCDLLPDVYRTTPTSSHYKDPTFKTFDLAINNFESDLDVRYLISVLQDQTKLHLYYEHSQVDDPLELNEEDIRELERVEDERMEQEVELKRK